MQRVQSKLDRWIIRVCAYSVLKKTAVTAHLARDTRIGSLLMFNRSTAVWFEVPAQNDADDAGAPSPTEDPSDTLSVSSYDGRAPLCRKTLRGLVAGPDRRGCLVTPTDSLKTMGLVRRGAVLSNELKTQSGPTRAGRIAEIRALGVANYDE